MGEGGGGKMSIECQTCGWIGRNKDLVAAHSDNEPCCPSCGGADFLDIEEDEDENLQHRR